MYKLNTAGLKAAELRKHTANYVKCIDFGVGIHPPLTGHGARRFLLVSYPDPNVLKHYHLNIVSS